LLHPSGGAIDPLEWLELREWRNWQTRQVEGLVVAIPCRFKSCFPHSLLDLEDLFHRGAKGPRNPQRQRRSIAIGLQGNDRLPRYADAVS
jgi:hypothetical protein